MNWCWIYLRHRLGLQERGQGIAAESLCDPHTALLAAQYDLEMRVAERTAELATRNAELALENRERIRAEEHLQLYQVMFANTSEAIVITDHANEIVAVNPAYCEITGYALEELIGGNPRIAKSGHHDKAFYQALWTAIRTEGKWAGEIWDRRKNGEFYPKRLSINTIRNAAGETTHHIGIFSDISKLKRNEQLAHQLADYDRLTGLPNRDLFAKRLHTAKAEAKAQGTLIAILFIDLDHFKALNDSLGLRYGDLAVMTIAERLHSSIGAGNTVAHIQGDKFLAFCTGLEGTSNNCFAHELGSLNSMGCVHETAEKFARTLFDAICKPMMLAESTWTLSASIGVALYPEDGAHGEALVKHAEAAMYHAKTLGRNQIQFFTAGIQQRITARLALEKGLRQAIEREEFCLYYQPLLDLPTGRVTAYEALIRWQHPERGLVPPDSFIPLAEETGLIVPMGEWALRTACRQIRRFLDNNPEGGACRIAVNLSARQFATEDLVDTVARILKETGVPAEYLELEITESTIMQDAEKTIRILNGLTELGTPLTVDDFGTGYSSLAYLKRFPVGKLKIDRSFIIGIPEDSNDKIISSAIISLAKSLNLRVVAEGVETQEQLDFLHHRNCDFLQGYFIGRPAPIKDDAANYGELPKPTPASPPYPTTR
jgi:diguanylate cyclase (GGDEF)-like protein/PAS domain S-box-containing protein